MSNDVSVTIDVANQSIASSDTNIIAVPTQNFEIVTYDNKPCIRAINDNYVTFTISPTIKSLSCDVFLQAVDGFTLLIEFDTVLNTKYSLVYYPSGSWWNPDRVVFDSNNVLVGVWVTVTYSSTNKTITFDNGTNQLTRVIDSSIADLSIGNFGSRYNIYLTNLGAETSSRYINKPGLSEIWANIKSYIAAQLLSFIPINGGSVITGSSLGKTDDTGSLQVCGGSNGAGGASILLNGKNRGVLNGYVELTANDGTDSTEVQILPDGTMTKIKGASTKNFAMQEDVVPRSGGAVMTNWLLARSSNGDALTLCGGTDNTHGASIGIFSTGYPNYGLSGSIRIGIQSYTHNMYMYAGGTWTWDGTAVQITSDQRLKQQIAEIDDKLLDAWGDVELSQFKYNDAVDQKGDNARLHTGYVVQQINDACQKHGVDISAYGLYCHEEYPQEVKEVEVKQANGTKTKETKVIREANEHYSLRYTEVYAVECMYLRRCIARLTARIEELEKGNNIK